MKILFLCGHYADGKYSNSICVKNIAEAFAGTGRSVNVVAWGDEAKEGDTSLNGVEVTYVKEPQFQKVVEYFSTKGTIYRILFKMIYVIRYFINKSIFNIIKYLTCHIQSLTFTII